MKLYIKEAKWCSKNFEKPEKGDKNTTVTAREGTVSGYRSDG